ncbi:MAG: nucleoside 2-deoxyribosyltransferase domain-containing protein [Actinomycetota bacterium]|nr:nucleoside 2-deoxyribosyltransferase domain-containing protein [Actinomycetota bacterium]
MQPAVVDAIRAAGFNAYDFRNPEGGTGFAWSEIDPAWEEWTAAEYVAALKHPRAVEGFASDFEAMQRADIVVLVLPCGRSAHLELGWAVGAGRRTAILTRDGEEPELMAKMVDHITADLDDLLSWMQGTS